MEGQAILTNYFTAAKSRQNSHPAKRRKVVADGEVILSKSAKLGDEKCVSLSQQKVGLNAEHASRPMASTRTKQASRSRIRYSKTKSKAAQNKIVSEGVVSVTTSLKDDHVLKRSRKRSQINNIFEPSASKIVELAISSATGHGEGKPSQIGPLEVRKSETGPEEMKANKTEEKIPPSLSQTLENTNTDSNSAPKRANIASQSRAGLKVNPWIAEQAKVVLSSRGKQALEKSLGRKKATGTLGKLVKEEGRVVAKEMPKVEKSYSVGVKPKVDVPRLSQGVTMSMGAKANSLPGER